MLNFPPAVRIWLGTQPVDLRKSFDSLAEQVRRAAGAAGDGRGAVRRPPGLLGRVSFLTSTLPFPP